MKTKKPTYLELEERLAAAEPIVDALKRHEVDAVVGEEKITFLLLREVGEALLSSEADFRAIFDLPGVGMVQADTPAFRFTRVNGKFCEMTGYTAEKLLTKTYIGLTHQEDRLRDLNGFARVLRGESNTWSIEKRFIRKNGSAFWVQVNGVALRDESGRVVKMLAMIGDITARKASPRKRKPAPARKAAR